MPEFTDAESRHTYSWEGELTTATPITITPSRLPAGYPKPTLSQLATLTNGHVLAIFARNGF